jgi:hypothetical protein
LVFGISEQTFGQLDESLAIWHRLGKVTKTNVFDYLDGFIEPSATTAIQRNSANPTMVPVEVVQLVTVDTQASTSSSEL